MRRRFAIALAATLAGGFACAAVAGLVYFAPTAQPVDHPAQYISSVSWPAHRHWFGGLSGIDTLNGTDFTAISDRGFAVRARVTHDGDILRSIETGRISDLDDLAAANNRKLTVDSEGLVLMPDGTIRVSFEQRNRVVEYAPPDTTERSTEMIPDTENLSENGGLEALAVHPDGRLFAIPEGSFLKLHSSFPVYVRWPEGWRISGSIPASSGFLPVGADFDELGRLYVLERSITFLGLQSRVRRFDVTQMPYAEEVLMVSQAGEHGNLEGLTVWRNGSGLVLTMVSDNNFMSSQKQQIVEYLLPD